MILGDEPFVILLILLLSHVLVDFFVQPRSWIEDRRANVWRSRKLYVHSLLAGVIPFILLGSLDNWLIIPIFALSHLLIDGVKARYDDDPRAFIVDQALHMAVVVLVWIFAFGTHSSDSLVSWLGDIWNGPRTLLVLLGVAVLTMPSGIFIGKVMQRWAPTDDSDSAHPKGSDAKGLADAGRYIGFAERLMIFVLVLANQFTVIGFVIATKSIFRLREGSERAEYYLIGTMLSFSIAIAVSISIRYLMGW